MQRFVIRYVADDHVHEVVEVPGHEVTSHDLWSVCYSRLERVERGLGLTDEGYLDEYIGSETDSRGIHKGHVAVYVAALLEAPDTAQAG